MHSPSQYENALATVASMRATTDILPGESLRDYIARQLKRSPEDYWVDAYILDIRKYARFAGEEYNKLTEDGERMGDYWMSRMIERIDDVKAARPAPTEFLASVPASAGERIGQAS